jgi:hypothetical protein
VFRLEWSTEFVKLHRFFLNSLAKYIITILVAVRNSRYTALRWVKVSSMCQCGYDRTEVLKLNQPTLSLCRVHQRLQYNRTCKYELNRGYNVRANRICTLFWLSKNHFMLKNILLRNNYYSINNCIHSKRVAIIFNRFSF